MRNTNPPRLLRAALAALTLFATAQTAAAPDVLHDGLLDIAWNEKDGRLLLAIDDLDTPLIYQASLARGVGSNDIGLDRGQLGSTALVSFQRVGPKVLLIEHNLAYRASTGDPFEQEAVDASFARSVLWGFNVAETDDGRLWVDATGFALRDSHGLAQRLKDRGHGQFAANESRSAVYLPRTRAFPDNTEIEATVTFTGTPEGDTLATVVPDATAITVHLHHSFIRLPDDGYTPLAFEPRSGFMDTSYTGSFLDYGMPIDQPTSRAFVRRHRLVKTTPGDAPGKPVEPIVYYLDRGAPEPVRQALIDGALWWNDAFTDAGFIDAFDVRLLPEDADPMDVRYNVIQWVHRSTRGWSYGSSVTDPRTGEILKGHVTLGSLRVRQDHLLAEGLLSPFANSDTDPRLAEMALARIRQLSAHEVGHTLGLEHNFAGSADDRSSVMDYPFPRIGLRDGRIDLSDAYGVGIGRWDRRAIGWGYRDFSASAQPEAARAAYLEETYASGLRFVADRHARAVGSMHPDGNLWDNGADAIVELQHLQRVRAVALDAMGTATVRSDRPLSTVEEALVPIYLLHRYQIQAVGKLIGGARFGYAPSGKAQPAFTPVPAARQREALTALLATLSVDELALPASLVSNLGPRPPGFTATRELFDHRTGDAFDPLAPAAAYADLLCAVLLDPARAARLSRAEIVNESGALNFDDVLDALMRVSWDASRQTKRAGAHQRVVTRAVARHLTTLMNHPEADGAVRASVRLVLERLHSRLSAGRFKTPDAGWRAHDVQLLPQLDQALRSDLPAPPLPAPTVPPGSPIG